MYEIKLNSNSYEDTINIAKSLGESLCGDNIILLNGDLAAGKTVFSKGIALGIGIKSTVKSPTYTVMCQYHGRLTLNHIDAYNLESSDDFYNLGFDELVSSDSVMVIEWASVIKDAITDDYIEVNIVKDRQSENCREITIIPKGTISIDAVRKWEDNYAGK